MPTDILEYLNRIEQKRRRWLIAKLGLRGQLAPVPNLPTEDAVLQMAYEADADYIEKVFPEEREMFDMALSPTLEGARRLRALFLLDERTQTDLVARMARARGYPPEAVNYYAFLNRQYHVNTFFLWCPVNCLLFGVLSLCVWGDFFSWWLLLPAGICAMIRFIRFEPAKVLPIPGITGIDHIAAVNRLRGYNRPW